MITFVDLRKALGRGKKARVVLDHVTAEFVPGISYGVLARSGEGKTTLIRLLCGAMGPDYGHIERNATVSYPIGYSGWLSNELSGAENVAFMARLFGRDVDEFIDEVFHFAELAPKADKPLRDQNPVQRSKLCYGISFNLDFDFHLVDEAIGVGNAAFRAKCFDRLMELRDCSGLIATGSNWTVLTRFCDVGCVLHQGRFEMFDSLHEARKFLDWIAPE